MFLFFWLFMGEKTDEFDIKKNSEWLNEIYRGKHLQK